MNKQSIPYVCPTILITGAQGQVGYHLCRIFSVLGHVIMADRHTLNLANTQHIEQTLNTIRPHIIINAAAYTAVDLAEQESELAHQINHLAVAQFATWCRTHNALLIHYSTDYVFNGTANTPYLTQAPCQPINTYGLSKYLGEQALQDSGCNYVCLRTTWVYDSRGKNFVRTMIKLAQEREQLSIVNDQIGAPTWARDIATATLCIARTAYQRLQVGSFTSGIYHYTGATVLSWHAFAEQIFELAKQHTPLKLTHTAGIASAQYPTPAKRPAYSVLDMHSLQQDYGIVATPLEHCLPLVIQEIFSTNV